MPASAKSSTVFDRITEEYMNSATASQMLADSMSGAPSKMKRVPLRFRIIALGFVIGESLDGINTLLKSQNCLPLYARSFLESGLIYAFNNHLSYEEWKALCKDCEEIRRRTPSEVSYFSDNKIRIKEISRYVRECSDSDYSKLRTSQLTHVLEHNIISLSKNSSDFEKFFTENIYIFSEAREKTRYYFCKYLWYYLSAKIDNFVESAKRRPLNEDDFLSIIVIKGVTPLRRKKMSPDEILTFLNNCDLSCGALFSEFNRFYFDYVSRDWVRILIEYLDDPEELAEDQREALLEALRSQYADKASLSDEKLLEWAFTQMEDEDFSDEENRLGETTIRKYIKGQLDLDRTTLICFLLYLDNFLKDFSDSYKNDNELKITRERLNTILSECGFPILRAEDDFDAFVLRFLRSDDPLECIVDEVTNYAIDGENSYLYHLFWSAGSQNQSLRKLMGLA